MATERSDVRTLMRHAVEWSAQGLTARIEELLRDAEVHRFSASQLAFLHRRLAASYERAGNRDAAKAALIGAEALFPDDPRTKLEIAQLTLNEDNPRDALSKISEAVVLGLDTAALRHRALILEGRAALRLGRVEEAVNCLNITMSDTAASEAEKFLPSFSLVEELIERGLASDSCRRYLAWAEARSSSHHRAVHEHAGRLRRALDHDE